MAVSPGRWIGGCSSKVVSVDVQQVQLSSAKSVESMLTNTGCLGSLRGNVDGVPLHDVRVLSFPKGIYVLNQLSVCLNRKSRRLQDGV